jgi:hypothetical protein
MRFRGLGDLVAFMLTPLSFVLQPVLRRFGIEVGVRDEITAQGLIQPPSVKKECGCKKRQEMLNKLVPFTK